MKRFALSQRGTQLPQSGIRQIMAIAAELESKRVGPSISNGKQSSGPGKIIHLEVGQPDLPPPDHVLEATTMALKDPACWGYIANAGEPQTREAVARFLNSQYHQRLVETTMDNVIVTPGSISAIVR